MKFIILSNTCTQFLTFQKMNRLKGRERVPTQLVERPIDGDDPPSTRSTETRTKPERFHARENRQIRLRQSSFVSWLKGRLTTADKMRKIAISIAGELMYPASRKCRETLHRASLGTFSGKIFATWRESTASPYVNNFRLSA